MDLNLYLGLPPLPRPPGRLGAAMDCPAPAGSPVPRPDDEPAAGSPAPEQIPPPPPLPAAYSPSNAVSTPEMPPIDPILVDWLDGSSTDDSEDYAGDPAVPTDLSSSDDGLGTGSEDALHAGQPALPSDASSSDDDGLSSDSEYYVLLPDLVIPEISTEDDEPAGLLAAQEEVLRLDEVDSPDSWGVDLPMIFAWSDGLSTDSEEALDAGEPAVGFDASAHDANASPPPPPQQLPLAGLEGVRLEWVERLSRPDRAAPAARAEMVSTRQSVGGAIEDTTHELRLQRVIQVSEQHHIVRPGPANRNQRATSPDAERLAQAIQRSHNSLDASRRQNLDANGKVGGKGAVKNDGNYCGCDASFECNICLDAAREPVVTPCGHLFCWPCLYQWLHAHSTRSECPVCKGEVLEVNVTPIYGRGGGERDASSSRVPPRPSANRSESLRQELQMPDPRGIVSMVRQELQMPDRRGIASMVRGQAAPPVAVGDVEVAVLPEGGTRVARTVRRRASPSLASPSPLTMRHVRRNAAPESGNPVEPPSSNSDNAATTVPQQSSSVEQASTSSTVAVIVGQAAQSRRSRPSSESATTTTRRMRRRQQH
ncbi:hypothetical protein QYE76_007280 [Lolium multiflorum]|uniref:E3 ubiquitin-protein ligase RMA n=1 Tax=Lolium multiflorum TaxID=4521 RepID=A0AAD8RXB3_LOLMU|nr:hypothetical protein QYE76_007280 [Lolium multiflorum]